jgi:uncharacterized protein (TIGR02646 family)
MIKVNRAAKPQSLVAHSEEWTSAYLEARAVLEGSNTPENRKRKKQAEGRYAQRDIRAALMGRTMFHRKCAFCERKRDYPHIEHFKPKDIYPKLCFDWENMLLGCEVCNGAAYKGTKFPLDAAGDPLFVNPCEQDPDLHFDFVFEEEPLHPDGFIAVVRSKTLQGTVTEREIGLNRANLIEERNELLIPYHLKIALDAAEGDAKAKSLLKRACQPSSVFAAFARSLWRRFFAEDF